MATTGLSTAVPHTSSLEQTRDAAPPRSSAETDMRCPDPSAHLHQAKDNALQNQASAAALYSTNAARANEKRGINPLGPDGKLSSASAAASLKYARPQDLPSFPSVGIDIQSSASAAALLANQNKKSPEWWKPEQSAAAGKAALLAHDYKMKPLWQPEASAAGSKAALLAHRDGVKLNLWTPEASSEGHSAANIAMRNSGPSAQVDYGYTDDGRRRALIAATGAHSASDRKRAQSNPPSVPQYPDAKNSAKNALSAATMAHSPSMRAAKPQAAQTHDSNRLGHGAMEAARIQHAKSISRDMYTSAPPVALEVEERKRNDALRASAISMARKMYDPVDGTSGRGAVSVAQTGATAAHGQRPSTSDADIKKQAMQYIGIQEAAQKLAQERLAKIGYDENAAYRSYYGYEKPNQSKLTMRRGRTRARSTSNAPATDSDSDEDDFRSRRIRSQMDQFNKQLADVDAKKRESDRKGLLAAAERKVHAQMQGLDKKIYDETGKMSSAMMDDWDEKARQRALANSEARLENHGRVNIGNGKWMDQGEIDAIAQARIQPTLDEITEKTTKRRAEEEERRLDLEEQKRQEKIEKERAAEIKAEERKGKEEEKRISKARIAEEKAAAKQEKEAERTKKAEEQRLAKEEKRKSKEAPREPLATAENDDLYDEPTPAGHVSKDLERTSADPTSPTSPTSPSSSKGIKSIFSKLKRSRHDSAGTVDARGKNSEKEAGAFIGGAALRTSESQSHHSNSAIQPQTEDTKTARPTDLGDVEPSFVPHLDESNTDRYSDISSLSNGDGTARGRSAKCVADGETPSTGSEFEEAKDHFDANLAPPPTFTTDAGKGRVGSPVRDSKFHEMDI